MRLTDYPAAASLDGTESLLGVKAGAATLFPILHLPNTAPVVGLTPTSLGKWRTALAKQRAGQANARVALVGDSGTVGYLAAPSPNGYVGAQPYGRVAALVRHLNAMGETAQQECFINDGNVNNNGATLPQYDVRVALTAGWAALTNTKNFGGNSLNNSTTTNPLSFTPALAFDTIEVVYGTAPGAAFTFAVNVDGGATLATPSCNAPYGYAKATVSCALGTHTVNIVPPGNATISLVGINVFNSARKSILAFPIAAAGFRATDFSTGNGSYGAGPNLAAFPADLYVIDLSGNDWIQGTSLAAFQTALQLAVTQCSALGSVILMSCPQSNTASYSAALQQGYRSVSATVAAANGAPYLDIAQAWGSYAQASGFGLMGDSLHPNLAGYNDLAGMIAQIITKRL